MKDKIKYFLCLLIILILPKAVHAQNCHDVKMKFTNSKGEIINVVSKTNDKNSLSQAQIQELIDSNNLREGETLTIYEVSDGKNSDCQNNSSSEIDIFNNENFNFLSGFKYRTSINSSKEVALNDYFITSAAKGQTIKLSSTYTRTVTTSIIAGTAFVKGDIGGSITAEYKETQSFKGPPENSYFNSREYRVKFYGNKVSFTQYKINSSNNKVVDKKTGKALVPTRFSIYSIDRRI